MKRLIYAEDAIESIRDEIKYKENRYATRVFRMAKRVIDSVPTVDQRCLQPVGKWISVKDRLPDSFDVVLVYSDGFISISWRETEKRKNGIVGWHWNSYPDSFGYVTHWMPLPEPPEVTP